MYDWLSSGLRKDKIGPHFISIYLFIGISINCFKCHSKDYRACDASREVKSCSGRNKQCYSLRYYSKINDDIEDHGFIKGCKDEKQVDCHSICQHYLDFGYEKCRVCMISRPHPDYASYQHCQAQDSQNSILTNLIILTKLNYHSTYRLVIILKFL